jgi:hypothetical protein
MADTSVPLLGLSPTGTPVISPRVVPILSALPALLAAIALALPQHTLAAHLLPTIAAGLGGLLGILSPGLRKPNP